MDIPAFGNISFRDWVQFLLHPNSIGIPSEDMHFFQIFASNAMDLVWFNRNLAAHGNVSLNPIELAIKVNVEAAVRDSLYCRDSSV